MTCGGLQGCSRSDRGNELAAHLFAHTFLNGSQLHNGVSVPGQNEFSPASARRTRPCRCVPENSTDIFIVAHFRGFVSERGGSGKAVRLEFKGH